MGDEADCVFADNGEYVKVPKGYCRSGVPKGFAAFFRRNDEEIGVYWERMMGWVNRDNCFDVARSTVHFKYREHINSLNFLGMNGSQEYGRMRRQIEAAYQEDLDEIFVAEFCAPEGTPEFFG